MLDWLFHIIAPHSCYGCGQLGVVLCSNCKYNIVDEPVEQCIYCGLPSRGGLCRRHRLPYSQAWVAAIGSEPLETMIRDGKYRFNVAAMQEAARLLNEVLPGLPTEVVVVPVPTVSRHIRIRGYDHTLKIARFIARQRGLSVRQVLRRETGSVQVGSDKSQRIAQAKTAFRADERQVTSGTTYLLMDDIMTTGATIHYAAKALKQAGADQVWVAVVAQHRNKD